MTTITLEGKEYQLDIEQAKKLNLLKEKGTRVKSWDEFKEKYITDIGYVYTEETNTNKTTSAPLYIEDQLTPHEAKAIAAFSKLLKLRRDWIGEWEPDLAKNDKKFLICRSRFKAIIFESVSSLSALSFPTEQMAIEFLETFRGLIEEAKILI